MGALFESLAAQSVRIYADAASARVGHLRTKETDREIDLIVEGEDRRVVALEVKLSESVNDKDAIVERPDGTRLRVRVAGAGPTVVLAHGIALTLRE